MSTDAATSTTRAPVVPAGNGPLVVIGGHEDKEGERAILRAVAEALDGGRLVLATVASHEPEGYLETYQRAFADLGVDDVVELYVDDRAEAMEEGTSEVLADADGVFLTGGDQLRITSMIADTPVERRIRELWERGGVVAGTSAGASVLSSTMLVSGSGHQSFKVGDLQMGPGLGLLDRVVVDQHFARRGRIGRLLGAVAHHPGVLGLGIDEDTAVLIRGDAFTVLGSGAVYVVDGSGITRSAVAQRGPDETVSIHDVLLHVLGSGETFDLGSRRPEAAPE